MFIGSTSVAPKNEWFQFNEASEYLNLGMIPGYTTVNGCMASEWHPTKDIDKTLERDC